MSKPKPYRDLPLDVYSLTAPRIINGSLDLDEKLNLQLVVRYFCVSCFATASILYVTVNGIPSVLWKTKAEPTKTSEPVLIGVLVTMTGVLEKAVIVERAMRVVLSIH